MEILALLILLVLITLLGHGIWLAVRGIFRWLAGSSPAKPQRESLHISRCPNCKHIFEPEAEFCAQCGYRKPSGIVVELLTDLAATERQLERFYHSGAIDDQEHEKLSEKIQSEKARLGRREPLPAVSRIPEPTPPQPPPSVTESVSDETTSTTAPPSVVIVPLATGESFPLIDREQSPGTTQDQTYHSVVRPEFASQPQPKPTAAPPQPHKPFSEVLASFMEESNIRWGEIVGGLLIIGCSTALVVSLWAQISRIPVLKFLIFTTVTAALFGVGLYTQHRWKLPTTSHGILTIATLLVPLNFLAIAAVSGSTIPPGIPVIGSELIAPALFLCLVYFAGRILTTKWPDLLAAGVLGSSVGQLLIRHFASPDNPPELLLLLGAFPIICYVTATGWMLRLALSDAEIDEGETSAIFTTLGAITFATLLPFGLLLYKSGPVSMSMMYLAPLVTLGGMPMLASGILLWRRASRELRVSRTAGTSIALAGAFIVLAGMILAWPNPASIVPAALLNFAIFTALAILLDLSVAHIIASFCLTFAWVVLFHVLTGHTPWQNLRVVSLVEVTTTISTGQALAPIFVLFVVTSEWWTKRRRAADGTSYLIAACMVAAISLRYLTEYGFNEAGDPHFIWALYVLYAIGAFWIAWRRNIGVFSWVGSFLLLVSLGQAFGPWLGVSFSWQAALLAHASISAAAAIGLSRLRDKFSTALLSPLNRSALITSFLAVVSLAQAAPWEPTAMQSRRVFWLATVWLALLWLNRRRALLISFKVALTCAVMLAIKAWLLHYVWYTTSSYGSLHPWSLQLQGSALVLLSIGWIALRLYLRHIAESVELTERTAGRAVPGWIAEASRLLEEPHAFLGRPVLWAVLGGFVVLSFYGALTGVRQELTSGGLEASPWNIAGLPHQYAFGAGSWILLGLLVIAFLATLWEGRRSVYLLGAAAAVTMISPLLAGNWEPEVATASAWRYLASMVLFLGLPAVWFRDEIATRLGSYGWPRIEDETVKVVRDLRVLLLGLTLTPLLLLTIYPALRAIYYRPIHGPASGFFASLNDGFSYSVPLVISALVLIGFALRDRLVAYAFSAGLFFNLTISIVYLLAVVAVHGNMDRVVLAHLVQLNTIVFALYAILWLSTRERWKNALSSPEAVTENLFQLQVRLAIVGLASVLIPVAVNLIIRPGWPGAGTMAAGGFYGWLAFVLTLIAALALSRSYTKRLSLGSLCAILLAVSCLLASTVARLAPEDWRAFHVLMFAVAGAAWLMCLARSLPSFVAQHSQGLLKRIGPPEFAEEWTRSTVQFATVIGLGTVLLALRAAGGDPGGAWWSISALLAMSALAGVLNWQTLQRSYLYAAGILITIATIIWLVSLPDHPPSGIIFVEINVIALCLSSIIWLWLELRARRLSPRSERASNTPAFHNLAALLSLMFMGAIAFIDLFNQATVTNAAPHPALLNWCAWASLALLMFACLWDEDATYPVAGLYLLGLLAAAFALDQLDLSPRHLGWAAMMAMAIYAIITGLVWRQRGRLRTWASNLKISPRPGTEVSELKWLQVFNAFLIFLVVWLAFWIELRFSELPLRLTSAIAVTMQAMTLVLVAGTARRATWQKGACALFTLGLVAFGWAWLTPGLSGTWLNRAVIVMVEMLTIVALFGLELEKAFKRNPEWTSSIRDCVPWLTAAGIISLGSALAIEVYYQVEFGAVRIQPLAVFTTGVTLVAATIICVLFALSPKHDPLNLSEPHRRRYVYAAEVMLALLFMHVRLTMPWLFSGFFERYWPLVVVVIAYLGVAASELLRRRNVLVLAHPIERTGVFLPLLPVLGFWRLESEVDYSVLLFIVGGLYGLLSILRRSFLWGILAALAGNGGFWYIWHRTEQYGFLEHPQLWLIPAACSVLLAAYLNRDDFSDEQMIGIRYLALMTIYVSSTADIFINGVANSPWLPMILAGLSVAGVLCGIMFRIRAFLILGSVFLLLAIITMIYYASANLGWTWLWYVAGIVTGAMIIFTFAVFEKKREEMLRLVEGLKEWQQ